MLLLLTSIINETKFNKHENNCVIRPPNIARFNCRVGKKISLGIMNDKSCIYSSYLRPFNAHWKAMIFLNRPQRNLIQPRLKNTPYPVFVTIPLSKLMDF